MTPRANHYPLHDAAHDAIRAIQDASRAITMLRCDVEQDRRSHDGTDKSAEILLRGMTRTCDQLAATLGDLQFAYGYREAVAHGQVRATARAM